MFVRNDGVSVTLFIYKYQFMRIILMEKASVYVFQ